MRNLLLRTVALTLLGLAPLSGMARAQGYPDKPITIVVPFAAGGPTDTVTRVVADAMSRELGQPIVIENAGGAGGMLGAARVARAAPDGYQLLLSNISVATNATIHKKLPYDTLTAFEHIGLVTEAPMVLVGRPTLEPQTLPALVQHVVVAGSKISMAHAGGASQLCAILFQDAVKTSFTMVPYKGTALAVTDLLAGNVDILCDQVTNTVGQLKANAIRGYATTTAQRLDVLPNIATASAQGLPSLRVGIWHGLFAPKGTPQPVVAALTRALQKALVDDKVKTRFAELGTAPSSAEEATPAALRSKVESEVARWAPLIRAAGLVVN
jgi:tripartite-type tricarboxylate transporter receptor subunit TctC